MAAAVVELKDPDATYLLTLEDDRASQNHAVAVNDGWIFDANEQVALKLCVRNLHRCLGTGYRCTSICSCYVFRKAQGRRKRKRGASTEQLVQPDHE